MQIRKAEVDDIEKVAQLMERNGYDRAGAIRRASSIGSNNKFILVLDDDSQVLGYSGIKKYADKYPINFDFSNCASILWVGVHSDFRHRGLGSRLVSACDNLALNWGREEICLECREAVIPFYVTNGYMVAGNYTNEKSKLRFIMVKSFYSN